MSARPAPRPTAPLRATVQDAMAGAYLAWLVLLLALGLACEVLDSLSAVLYRPGDQNPGERILTPATPVPPVIRI